MARTLLMTCIDDCFKKAFTVICGCAYPSGCGHYDDWTKECRVSLHLMKKGLQCNKQCLAECNQISFVLNRIDVEGYLDHGDLDDYKARI